MRFKSKSKPQPKEGDTRTKAGFLWLPKKLNEEWRWLERATWKQKCMKLTTLVPEGGVYSPGQFHLEWVSTEWA